MRQLNKNDNMKIDNRVKWKLMTEKPQERKGNGKRLLELIIYPTETAKHLKTKYHYRPCCTNLHEK